MEGEEAARVLEVDQADVAEGRPINQGRGLVNIAIRKIYHITEKEALLQLKERFCSI